MTDDYIKLEFNRRDASETRCFFPEEELLAMSTDLDAICLSLGGKELENPKFHHYEYPNDNQEPFAMKRRYLINGAFVMNGFNPCRGETFTEVTFYKGSIPKDLLKELKTYFESEPRTQK